MADTAYRTVLQSVWDEIDIYGDPESFLSDYARAPSRARLIFAAHWSWSEISNGGLWQFYYNSTGILAPEAIQALTAIGMPRAAKVIRESSAWFGKPYNRVTEERRDLIEQCMGQKTRKWFLELDEVFFESLRSENGGFRAAAERYAAKGLLLPPEPPKTIPCRI